MPATGHHTDLVQETWEQLVETKDTDNKVKIRLTFTTPPLYYQKYSVHSKSLHSGVPITSMATGVYSRKNVLFSGAL